MTHGWHGGPEGTGPGAFPPPRTPSGLFPSSTSMRPSYREPYPITGAGVAVGALVAFAWLLLFGLVGGGVAGYAWWTLLAGGLAWLAAAVLVRHGDRGGDGRGDRHRGWLEHRRSDSRDALGADRGLAALVTFGAGFAA